MSGRREPCESVSRALDDRAASTLDDLDEMGRVHVQVWREAYAGLMPDDYLAGLDPGRSRPAGAAGCSSRTPEVQPGSPATTRASSASTTSGPPRDDDAPVPLELYAINVLPAAHGTGVADDLMARRDRRPRGVPLGARGQRPGDGVLPAARLRRRGRPQARARHRRRRDPDVARPLGRTVERHRPRAGPGRGAAARDLEPRGQGRRRVDRVAFVWLYVVASRRDLGADRRGLGAGHRRAPDVVVAGRRRCVSGALHIVYQLVLQRGYAEGDLNLVYPLARGSGPAADLPVRGDRARPATGSGWRWRASSRSSPACC